MDSTTDYQNRAESYADSLRTLFGPAATRGLGLEEAAPRAPEELADQAERAVAASAALNRAAAAKLNAADPRVRAQAAEQLLAKAWTDLESSARLHQMSEAGTSGAESATRSLAPGAPAADLEQGLAVVLGASTGEEAARSLEAGPAAPPDLPAARAALANAVTTTLDLLESRAAKAAQAALAGVLGMGLANLGAAAGLVGTDLAQHLGSVGGFATRIAGAVHGFLGNALQAIQSLVGPALYQTGVNKVLSWADQWKELPGFTTLVEQVYQTKKTGPALVEKINASEAALDKFGAATTEVSALGDDQAKQMVWVDRIRMGLGFANVLPGYALPAFKLAVAAGYLLLGTYVLLAGADYVDAIDFKLLNRVPGVREVVQSNLGLT